MNKKKKPLLVAIKQWREATFFGVWRATVVPTCKLLSLSLSTDLCFSQ